MTDLLIDTSERVMTLTLHRVAKMNSLTTAMYAAMADALVAAQTDDGVRALVIQGHETVFCAGNDIADFLNRPATSPDMPVFRFLKAISTCAKPIVAAVCGPAVGIGTTMLFHCDLVYAGDNAAFSMPFVNLGVCPEAGSSLLAPQRMGYGRAAEALMLGEPFTAEAALEMGLVARIVPPSEANALAQRQARKLASKPTQALLAAKRLMKQGQAELLQKRIAEEGDLFGELVRQPAAREAFGAFLEKRSPDLAKF
ncbi:MAG: enoyl-CoA hydratase [Rhodoferax sp.]|nr:enoyl-CoA hydratase [Rhodoferax sp.]